MLLRSEVFEISIIPLLNLLHTVGVALRVFSPNPPFTFHVNLLVFTSVTHICLLEPHSQPRDTRT